MPIYTLIGVAAIVWFLSCATALVGIVCSYDVRRRVWGMVLAFVAALIAYLGLTRIHVSGSKTVNGQVQWKFDSKWLFIVALVFAVISFGIAFWNWRRARAIPPVI